MRHLIAAMGLAAVVLAGCPLGRPSATPEDACREAARTMERCATAATPKWDEAKTADCVATLRALATASPDDKGFTAARIRDCHLGVNRPTPTCPEQVSCVTEGLDHAARMARPGAK